MDRPGRTVLVVRTLVGAGPASECQSVMPPHRISANEDWIGKAGADIVEKRAKAGADVLSPRETLIYWLWWADYMMRNAGDFANAVALEKDFQSEILFRAKDLGLRFTAETFSLSRDELQSQYFDRFESVCDEIKGA